VTFNVSVNFLVKRALISVLIFIFVINLVFFLPRLVPGNAADILASSFHLPSQAVILISERLGLNQPLSVQYVTYLKNMFTTFPPYFGVSYLYYPTTVSDLFAARIPWSLMLMLVSIFLGFFLAYIMTRFTSTRRGGKLEATTLYASIALNSVPVFWLAMILLLMFSIDLRWFPVFGNVDVTATGVDYYVSIISHAILPIICLTLPLFGSNYLILRGSTQEVLGSDYVTAAKLRGLKDGNLASRYIVRNSLLPLVSVTAFSLASLISRLILVEAVFGYPGVGDLLVDAVVSRDYPVLEGSLFYLTVMILVGGLIGDYLLTRLDPRLRT
jgi:peptide/nickel transport system permease protein